MKDNRPPKHLRTLKKGDVRGDGMVFWVYKASAKNGESWLTRENYDERDEGLKRNKRERYAENREDINRKGREYYTENREEKKRKGREYYTENREEKKRYGREYTKANPAKVAAASSRRRAMIREAIHPDLDRKIEDTIFELRDRLTAKTGIPFHVDHIIPISRGGWHHHANLKVIPARLNQQKSARLDYQLPECWSSEVID